MTPAEAKTAAVARKSPAPGRPGRRLAAVRRIAGEGARRFARLLAGHRLISVLVGIGAALRAVVVIAYPPALEFHGDSYTYLANVANFAPRLDRPIGYPALLKLFSATGSLLAVTIFQHLLGLAIGVLIYALLRRLRAPSALAALAAAPVLLDGYQLDIEQFVLSETLFEALLVTAFAILVLNRRPTAVRCALSGALLAAAGLTRTVGLVLIVASVAYLLIARLGVRRIAALCLGFALPVLGYAGWFDTAHHRFDVSGYAGIFLYGETAPVADCATLRVPAYDRILCDPTPPALRLGPNYYDWSAQSPRFMLQLPAGVSYQGALSTFATQVMLQQPGPYLREVAGEVIHYFAPGRFVGPRDWYLATWRFPNRNPEYELLWHSNPATQGFGATRLQAHPVWSLAPFLRAYQDVVYTPGPFLALALACALGTAFVGRRRRAEADPRWRAGAVALGLSALALLVIPSATATFDYRYLLPVIVLLPAGGALGLLWLFPNWATGQLGKS